MASRLPLSPTARLALTDELAAPAYDVLDAEELDELIAGLEPIAAAV